MNPSSYRRSPFESPASHLFPLRKLLRIVRNVLFVAALGFGLVGLMGEPFLRWEYRYRGSYSDPYILDADYVGFSRRFHSRAHEHAEGCPVVLFLPHDAPCLWIGAACLAGALVIGGGGRDYPAPNPKQEPNRV